VQVYMLIPQVLKLVISKYDSEGLPGSTFKLYWWTLSGTPPPPFRHSSVAIARWVTEMEL